MDWTPVIVAAITSLGGVVASYLAVYFSNRKSAILVEYRLGQVEKEVSSISAVAERTYKLEEHASVVDEKIRVANHRLDDLEKKVS